MPFNIDAYSIVYLHSTKIFGGFPVPEPQFSISISWGQELAIRRKVESACIAWVEMSCKFLLPIHFEIAFTIIDHNLVVHGLASEVFSVWMHSGIRDGLHIRLAYMFCYNRYSEFPKVDLFVISCWDKTTPSLNESNCIYWTEMLLILLSDFRGISIVLQNFLVCASCEENVLSVIWRMEFNTKWRFSVSKTLNDFSCLGVP